MKDLEADRQTYHLRSARVDSSAFQSRLAVEQVDSEFGQILFSQIVAVLLELQDQLKEQQSNMFIMMIHYRGEVRILLCAGRRRVRSNSGRCISEHRR